MPRANIVAQTRPKECNVMPYPKMLHVNFEHLLTWANNTQYVVTCRNRVATCAQQVPRTLFRRFGLTCYDYLAPLISLKSVLRPKTTLKECLVPQSKVLISITSAHIGFYYICQLLYARCDWSVKRVAILSMALL